MANDSQSWSFWIDRGGTFTDVVARDPQGQLHIRKLLSDNPEHYQDAPIQAIRELLKQPEGPLPASAIEAIKMGTTVATNALLERQGEAVCLIITEGFRDLLEIGTQNRPDIFALHIEKPKPLVAASVEVDARHSAEGELLQGLRRKPLERALKELVERGFKSCAVVLIHSYLKPELELSVRDIARAAGFEHISLSHEVSGEIKMVSRGDTATVDAYLTPILRRYVERVQSQLAGDVALRFMQSHGGLVDARCFSGKDAILSGPAGGVVACAEVARRSGFERVIGFDMGGTSTDVCRYAGDFERVFETVTAGVRVQSPMLQIKTVAAGGGSLLSLRDGRFQVGPESAGANPGPVCYRRQGQLAVTDANAVLGRIQAEFFPACFGPEADQRLDVEAARVAFEQLGQELEGQTGERWSVEQIAAGFLRIANDNMVKPIRELSIARGYDVRDHALLCFGGAAPQHACAIADALDIQSVLIPTHAGVLSAYGMGLADIIHNESRAILKALAPGCQQVLEGARAALIEKAAAHFEKQGLKWTEVRHKCSVDLRVVGVDESINCPCPSLTPTDIRTTFEQLHKQRYGFVVDGAELELVTLRLESTAHSPKDPGANERLKPQQWGPEAACATVSCGFYASSGVERLETPVYRRDDMPAGTEIKGPALIVDAISTTVLDPHWCAHIDASRTLVLSRSQKTIDSKPAGNDQIERDPVRLELFNNVFMSIAEQMGVTLQRVSHSTNVKERLDFSCALFDHTGQLIANAPHIPVHLGAMGESVQAVVDKWRSNMQPGDVFVTNDPYNGGSHLPDVTVVSPIFNDSEECLFFVANRGHHSDIGGITPGSMPPFSKTIDEEGIRLQNLRLVSAGQLLEDELVAALRAGEHPARNIKERLSDLRAQLAANKLGERLLRDLVAQQGAAVVQAYMGYIRDNAAEAMRAVLASLPQGRYEFTDHLDDGARVHLLLSLEGSRATLDFRGSSGQLSSNLNAPKAVVKAATLYAFRTLFDRAVPLNAGCLEPLEILVEPGSMLDPQAPAAVVGGNVETSQRLVDVIYGALRVVAASQGTMNNLTFGHQDFGYYETICGGTGAGFGFDGCDAVHSHMTNTRITDPEVLETRYPVRLRRFDKRQGSGGRGVWSGGEGVVRELEFLEPVTVSVLSERRAIRPYGLNGAGAGARGRNSLMRDGAVLELPGKFQGLLQRHDRLRLETPGGGAYNPSAQQWAEMSPARARRLFREGRASQPTAAMCAGFVQANLVILPAAFADDFEAFCQANAQACPLLERSQPGRRSLSKLAQGLDLARDLPKYRSLRRVEGRLEEAYHTDLAELWQDDWVSFLLGCSFSFEDQLMAHGFVPRHVELGCNVPMYRTNRMTVAKGPFSGPLVVSMRPFREQDVAAVTALTQELTLAHGAPVQVGEPEALGIADLADPDYGDAVPLREGEQPVFWACGVTSQEALESSLSQGLSRVFSHAPGHMLISDWPTQSLLGKHKA